MHRAIICVDQEKTTLMQIEQMVVEHFINDYVIETAENSNELLRVLKTLNSINIDTAVLIAGFNILNQDGLKAINKVKELNKKTQIIFYAGQMDFTVAAIAINHNVFRIIKRNAKREEVIQTLSDACSYYEKERELEDVYLKLKASEYEKRLILESIAEGMLLIDENYNIIWANEIVRNEFDICENTTQKCYELFYNITRPCNDCKTKKITEEIKSFADQRKFGNNYYKNVKHYPVKNKNGRSLGVLISLTDITNQKKVDKMNKVLLEVAKCVNHSDSIIQLYQHIYDIIQYELSVTYMCVAGKDFDNVYIEYINGRDKLVSYKKIKPKEYEHILYLMGELLVKENNNSHHNYIIIEENEEIEISIRVNEKIIILVFNSIEVSKDYLLTFVKTLTEQIKTGITRIESIKRITYQANHDSLTGLYNRDYFMKTINSKIFTQRESDHDTKKYSLAVLDLNFFKEVNDTYGHIVGDEVLFEISQRIMKSLRHGDIVARIGGDEFAILLQLVSKEEVICILTRVQETIAKTVKIENDEIHIGSSIGLVYEIDKYSNSEQAIKDADIAMYEAKKDKSGIGTCRFFERNSIEK